MWKTHAKQIFCSQNYSNTVLETNFSQHLNTSLKNTKQKTLTKHTHSLLEFEFINCHLMLSFWDFFPKLAAK
jgi:hypothetical protein